MADDESTSTQDAEEAMLDTSVDVEESSGDTEDSELDDVELTEADLAEAEDEDDTSDSEETEAVDEPSEEEAPEEEAEPELSDEEAQKQHNREMAERRLQEKEARIARVREAQAQYVAEAQENEDPLDAAVRQLQVDAYNNTVQRVESSVTNDYQRALNDNEILRNPDPVIQNRISKAIDAFQAQHVSIDQFGNPVDVRGDLYQYLQDEADDIARLTGIRNQRQTQSKEKQKSKALVTPTRSPKEPKVDPDLAAFDEEAYGTSS